MTREEAIKHVKAHIKSKYRRQKVLAYQRGMSKDAVSRAVHNLAPWLLRECGLTKRVEVTFEVSDAS